MVELHIVLNELGQVSVTGPLENRLLCYGLLEAAKEVIAAHQAVNQNRVQPATHFGPIKKGS
jgi:hypothetical protein